MPTWSLNHRKNGWRVCLMTYRAVMPGTLPNALLSLSLFTCPALHNSLSSRLRRLRFRGLLAFDMFFQPPFGLLRATLWAPWHLRSLHCEQKVWGSTFPKYWAFADVDHRCSGQIVNSFGRWRRFCQPSNFRFCAYRKWKWAYLELEMLLFARLSYGLALFAPFPDDPMQMWTVQIGRAHV